MSIFSPVQLRSLLDAQGGIAYNDKYMVTLNKPPAFEIGGGQVMRQSLSMLCDTATLPTKSLATFEKSIYGPVKAMPYRMTFTEASMSFIMRDQMNEKKYFDAWQNKIVDQKSGNLGFFDDYVCDITIQKFSRAATDSSGTPAYAITLIDAWPSIVSEVQLSHSGGTEAMKLPVTFQFKKWESDETTSGPSTGAGGPPR